MAKPNLQLFTRDMGPAISHLSKGEVADLRTDMYEVLDRVASMCADLGSSAQSQVMELRKQLSELVGQLSDLGAALQQAQAGTSEKLSILESQLADSGSTGAQQTTILRSFLNDLTQQLSNLGATSTQRISDLSESLKNVLDHLSNLGAVSTQGISALSERLKNALDQLADLGVVLNNSNSTLLAKHLENSWQIADVGSLLQSKTGELRNNLGLVLRKSVDTEDATPTELLSYTPVDLMVVIVKAEVLVKNEDGSKANSYSLAGTFRRAGNGIVEVGTSSKEAKEEDVDWDANFALDGTEIKIQVTGEAATILSWFVRTTVTEA